jgi:hypothetical protein
MTARDRFYVPVKVYGQRSIIITALLGAFVIAFSGCSSQIVPLDRHLKGWMGRDIDEMRKMMAMPESYASQIHWKETTYVLPNGNSVFLEPEPHCRILWEVNKEGVIVGYKTEGEECR